MEIVTKPIDIGAAVLVVGVAGLYQALFWKRVQRRPMKPAAPR
jgi:hypothetical protein